MTLAIATHGWLTVTAVLLALKGEPAFDVETAMADSIALSNPGGNSEMIPFTVNDVRRLWATETAQRHSRRHTRA